MCGRYVNKNTIEDIIGFFGSEIKFDESHLLKPSYNICPTQLALILRGKSNVIGIDSMNWGLIPSWSKNKKYASNLINARLETINDNLDALVVGCQVLVVAHAHGSAKQPRKLVLLDRRGPPL